MFEATFQSLDSFQCPDWFRDAKFGIWSHWGPQSVPMYGDWYARNMYIEGTSQYLYHLRHYGHPSQFGYKDVCKLWKAENFDPDGLMQLYTKAGARYFVAQAMHHDHFFNYPSRYNRFHSVNIGPGKDICGLWMAAARKSGIPFGLTEHLGASFSWWNVNKGADSYGPYKGVPYDGNDPAYRDFYHDNDEHRNLTPDQFLDVWYTGNKKFRRYWLDVMKELVDLYQPELLYSDGPLPFGNNGISAPEDADFLEGLEAVSYLYNASIGKHGTNQAVYCQKDRRREIYQVGVLDIEKSQLPGINPEPWQTDTCIGNWFYDVRQKFKSPGHIIEILVDIVSKNGNLLLNILQRPDGTLDEQTHYLLNELAGWMAICGEAIHATRPWRIAKEGNTTVKINGFEENPAVWSDDDYRFTQKGSKVYAFMMSTPKTKTALIKSFYEKERVAAVQLLGHGPLSFTQKFGMLLIDLPPQLPTEYVNCFEIQL